MGSNLGGDQVAASTEAMRSYWDERARENAMWFIHSLQSYTEPDPEQFWRSGEELLEGLLSPFGIQIGGDETVLEIGSGLGRIARAFAHRVREVVGVDVSGEMVERARRENTDLDNLTFVVGNGRDLSSFEDASFDLCYSFVVFQHIPDPDVTCGYVREIGRLLRPGGWTVFQVSDRPEVHKARHYGRRHRWDVRRLVGRAPRGCFRPQWLGSAVPRESLLRALEEGGLRLEGTVGDGTQFCLVCAQRR
jgi:SAM-dependent methyltransferase